MKIQFDFVMLGLLLQELLAFAKIQFPRFFSAAFWDIELKFGVWIYFGLKKDQVWVLSNLTFFYRSYCPLLKFIFQGFSMHESFEILT